MWQQQRYYWVLCWRGSDVRGCAFTLSSLNILTDWAVRTQAITTARHAIQDLQAEDRRVIVHAERHVPPRPGRPSARIREAEAWARQQLAALEGKEA